MNHNERMKLTNELSLATIQYKQIQLKAQPTA